MKKSILTFLLAMGFYAVSLRAQEVRVQGEIMILGYIGQPFVGAGVGIEAPLGTHFSLNFDANWGNQDDGTALEFRPAVNYYFGQEQKGMFVGAALKYIKLSERDESTDMWENNLYTLGFNIGVKALLSESWTFGFTASPHVAVGGMEEGDVAGITAQLGLGYKF
jgi:hypothetical protein